ncbi:MAG: AAA family ATPase [Chthoniobacteraceae bacterium]
MQAHGAPPYPEALREAIFNEIPNDHRWDFGLGESSEVEIWNLLPSDVCSVESHERETREARAIARAEEKRRQEKLRQNMNEGFTENLREIAERELAQYLLNLCERPDVRFTRSGESRGGERAPWYFVRVADAILRFIDRRKLEIAATIAETAVSREIFHWLGKARTTARSIVISGNSRFGKTEAVRAWAAMNPGLARIVETPAAGGEGDFLRAIADALGIERGAGQRGHELREQIEFVLKQFRPVLIFEEASFLYPANFSKNTMPARLNWVRRSVMDREIPCAFVWTPQTHRDARNRFLKATNFAIEQFDGRILRTVNLPAEIPREDHLAIARIHFRELPKDRREVFSQLIVGNVTALERNYCSDVSNIAALTYSNAADAGRAIPNLEDIKAAIADVLPTATALPGPAPARSRKCSASPAPLRTSLESPLQTSCNARETRSPGIGAGDDSGLVEHSQFPPESRSSAAAPLPA